MKLGLSKIKDNLLKNLIPNRQLFFFTDGENLFDESQNKIFVENVKAGLRQAEWFKIPVYIFSPCADLNPQNYHSYDWAKEIPINYLDLMTAVRKLIHKDFKTPYLNILAENSSAKNLTFEVPITAPDHLKIFLLSSGAGEIVNLQKIHFEELGIIFEGKTPPRTQFRLKIIQPVLLQKNELVEQGQRIEI